MSLTDSTTLAAGVALALALILSTTAAQDVADSDAPRGPYFGQQPPGTVPSVFAPGIVSLDDRYEYVIAFSPDGNESCFGVTDSTWSTCMLHCSRQAKGVWSRPVEARFQQGSDGWLPSFTPDGNRILFSSGRPTMKSANTWMSRRTAEGWTAPVQLASPLNSPTFDWRPMETAAGTVYFASDRSGGHGAMDIYRAVAAEDGSLAIENLGPPVNSPHLDASPFISPDERYLILESWRPGGLGKGDLYIAYRRSDGRWTEPENLGPRFNTEQIEDGGCVSPDGRYFFFSRREDWVTEQQTDIHWVDSRAVFKPYLLNPVGEVRAVVGERLVVRLPTDEFGDQDDGTLVYTATGGGSAALPGWLSFDPETRTLSGTPEAADSVSVEIHATDKIGSGCSDLITIRTDH